MPENRQRRDSHNHNLQYWSEGSAVRKAKIQPQRRPSGAPEAPKVSRQARQNRARALSMNRSFVLFLVVVSAVFLAFCVQYINLKMQITEKTQSIASLQTEYTKLKADNNAYESELQASVDLENIKSIAINELGMRYPTSSQIVEYQLKNSSFARQYTEVPEE
ncbi:MAG: hypothetical protein ACK5MN_08400 [Lachnospiraceae bacterium]